MELFIINTVRDEKLHHGSAEMTKSRLRTIAEELVADGKGILAADDDDKEMFKRFGALGIPGTTRNLHDYWEVLFAAPEMSRYISGVILCEEALLIKRHDGTSFPQCLAGQGILTGIVVDTGTKKLPSTADEWIADGMDGLVERIDRYARLGAQFSKWRAVIEIDKAKPSPYCIEANALELARFASLSQRAGLVPFVEPDVLIDGDHSLERCREVTEFTLRAVFRALAAQNVVLEEIILKPNMVLPGRGHDRSSRLNEVAEATLDVLRRSVPPSVPGIAFLSGGQSDQLATAHLNEINASGSSPWRLTFCFGRALQTRALAVWNGDSKNAHKAREAFQHRARLNSLAQSGNYRADLEVERPIEQPVV